MMTEEQRNAIIKQFLSEVNIYNDGVESTVDDKRVYIKVHRAKYIWELHCLKKNLTVNKLKTDLWGRYIVELKSEIGGLKNQIQLCEKQINNLQNSIAELNLPKDDEDDPQSEG